MGWEEGGEGYIEETARFELDPKFRTKYPLALGKRAAQKSEEAMRHEPDASLEI